MCESFAAGSEVKWDNLWEWNLCGCRRKWNYHNLTGFDNVDIQKFRINDLFFRGDVGNGTFVLVGDNGKIISSLDSVTWTPISSGITSNLFGVAYGNNTFVAVGENGTIITSPDLVTWTVQNSGRTGWLRGVTYGTDNFVAVGGGVIFSPDGVKWTSVEVSDFYNAVTCGKGTFVAVGAAGRFGFGQASAKYHLME